MRGCCLTTLHPRPHSSTATPRRAHAKRYNFGQPRTGNAAFSNFSNFALQGAASDALFRCAASATSTREDLSLNLTLGCAASSLCGP